MSFQDGGGVVSDSLEDLTIDNITSHVIHMSTQIDDARVKHLTTKLIQYLHDYVRDVQLQTDEWEVAWKFLTQVHLLTPSSELLLAHTWIYRHYEFR
jgi:hypothetical protein